MIKSLNIKNYAIVRDLELYFEDSFSVFTGETGAGKSIIIGAISLLMGERADTSVISSGQDYCLLEASFSLSEKMKEKLFEADIEYDDELIVRRRISKDSHNYCKINQQSVSLSFLNELFNEESDIHSQRDNQYLLNKNKHLKLLDTYCNNENLLIEYKEAYQYYLSCNKEYENLLNNEYDEARLDFIKYNLKELQEADIKENEEEELLNKEKYYKNIDKYREVIQNALANYDEEKGINERLYSLYKDLESNEATKKIGEDIANIYYELENKINELRSSFNGEENNEVDINYLQERLYLISKLKRKYSCDSNSLISKKEELEKEVRSYDDRETVLKESKEKLDLAYANAKEIANSLHEVRVKESKNLEKDIKKELDDLLLKNSEFVVDIVENELNNKGYDEVEFKISMNKGEELRSLNKVASGGELSRLMLGLKTVFSKLKGMKLVIFDEIDTGVSGQVALAMGEKMAKIASTCQVLAVTHLPAVAACGKYQYKIMKSEENNVTTTSIKQLDLKERINEIASLSGAQISETSLNAAKELYQQAQKACYED